MDYPAHKVKPTQLMKERPMTAAVPFTGASSYAVLYIRCNIYVEPVSKLGNEQARSATQTGIQA